MLDYLSRQLLESEKICERYDNFYTEHNKLKKENELLKEQLKVLKDEIMTIYEDMTALDTITNNELSDDIEEL